MSRQLPNHKTPFQRVIDLEEELQKQRSRMLDIVAEKDREIELTK
jgi:hypothetical protein